MTNRGDESERPTTTDADGDWTELPDDQLVAIYREWNVRYAFLALLRRHRGALLRDCVELVGAGEPAEELCRAVFAEAALRISALHDGAAFAAWLREIAALRTASSCA